MQPQNINSQLDSMLKSNQPAKQRRLPIPNLPKPALIGIVFVLIVIVLIIISSFLSGRKSGYSQPIIASLARGQEALRVTQAAQKLNLKDPATQSTAATVATALLSDQQQLLSYLHNNKIKVSDAQLLLDTDKSIDEQLQTAVQNNNLDQAYIDYLKKYLPVYQHDLQVAYNVAPGPKGRIILKSAFDGEATLLTNAPLKT
jgi:hypothetical protein